MQCSYVTGCSKGDYTTIKYDNDGNQIWVARFGSVRDDNATDIALDTSGNVYVTGAMAIRTCDSPFDDFGENVYLEYATVKYTQ